VQTVNDLRITRFKDSITTALAATDIGMFRSLIEQYEVEHDVPAIEIAAALARLAQGDKPLLLDPKARPERREFDPTASRERKDFANRSERSRGDRPERSERSERPRADRPPHPRAARTEAFSNPAEDGRKRAPETREPRVHAASEHRPPETGMETFRVEVGHMHGVKPGNIVGAIANEAELDSKHIGRITIREDHSLVDLPEGMPSEVLQILKKSWVAGQRLRITRGTAGEPRGKDDDSSDRGPRPSFPGSKPPPKHSRIGPPHKGKKPGKKY
jgi:ATP-dependent RNA helicase DeaD